MTTGHEVWLARRNAGLTQSQLGKQLGVSGATISYWERKAGEKVKPNNGAGARLEEFVGENLQPMLVADWHHVGAMAEKQLGYKPIPVADVENAQDGSWANQNAELDAAFNFDRAPETKRRWWQRFGRKG